MNAETRAKLAKHLGPVVHLALQIVPKEVAAAYLVSAGISMARGMGFNDDELRSLFETALDDDAGA